MARAVEGIGPVPSAPRTMRAPTVEPRPLAVLPVQSLPEVLPADPVGCQVGELCGSMALAAVLTTFSAVLIAAVGHPRDLTELGSVFFPTLAAAWGVLAVTKFWQLRRKDSWARRLTLAGLGAAIGLVTLWSDGWVLRDPTIAGEIEIAPGAVNHLDDTEIRARGATPLGISLQGVSALSEACATVSYFAIVFFAVRWWRLTDRRRAHRFSFAPLLGVGIWGCLMLLLRADWRLALALVTAAGIVQLVSPWEQTPAPSARRVRLRYA